MTATQQSVPTTITARNIGGITETEVDIPRGVTLLKGENATNRTSFLQAIMAALGSNNVSLRGGAEEGSVRLELDGEVYERELRRTGTDVTFDGEPYLDDPTPADLFAFLLESNAARQAVVNKDDFREIIMRPVDTDEIERQIERLIEERRNLEAELEHLDSLRDQLPALEERRTKLEDQIEEKRSELAAKEDEIDAVDSDIEETRDEKAELEEKLAVLREKRSNLEDVRYDIETEKEGIESGRSELNEAKAELDELPEAPVGEIDELQSQVEALRDRKRRLEAEVNEIQSVIRFNQEMLEDGETDVSDVLAGSSDDVTEELLPDDTEVCWTCGSEVQSSQIESTVSRLQELNENKYSEITDVESQIDELTAEIEDLKGQQDRRESLQRRIDEAETKIEQGEEHLESLTDRRESLQDEIRNLEEEIAELENDAFEEILALHKEANQLEYDLDSLEGDLEGVESEISSIEPQLAEEDDVEDELEAVEDEIQNLRTKIERTEARAIEEFNEHMDSVLEILEYQNLERVWIERIEQDVRQGRRKVTQTTLELHIIRKTETGKTYEDVVEHLSESEREVTGLIFALAGYLTHDVHDLVPFMLLDSLEAIDAHRIARLVEYLESYTEYLVVATLPEDAAAFSESYDRISDI